MFMLAITPKHKIFIAVQHIDFRRGIDGIAALCRQQWQLDPLSGHVFIFRNRKGHSIKVLAYDSQGLWLCQKRLSRGRFIHWPQSSSAVLTLTAAQLHVLLYNGDPHLVQSTIWRPIDDG
jgi:transposase